MDIHIVAINKARRKITRLGDPDVRSILSEVYPTWPLSWDDPRRALASILDEDPEEFALPALKRLGIRPKVHRQREGEDERLEALSDSEWDLVA